jgi:hypothetical protein
MATHTAITIISRRRGESADAPVELEVLAAEAGLHPELVRRLVRLGVIRPRDGTAAAPLFPRDAAAQLARIARLRRDLGLNYAGAALAAELLERIEELERRLRRYEAGASRR